MKYTREDVIFWPDDERLEGAIGKPCYMAKSPGWVLNKANDDFNCVTLDAIESEKTYPFRYDRSYASFIILKKEPEKKIIPFDFSLEEDRKALKGKWIKLKSNIPTSNEETQIVYINDHIVKSYSKIIGPCELLEFYVFSDTGKPVGKEVIE